MTFLSNIKKIKSHHLKNILYYSLCFSSNQYSLNCFIDLKQLRNSNILYKAELHPLLEKLYQPYKFLCFLITIFDR